MSKRERNQPGLSGKPKRSFAKQFSGAMAEAFKKAGLGGKSTEESKPAEHNPRRDPRSHHHADEKGIDRQVFEAAMAGVKPLESSSDTMRSVVEVSDSGKRSLRGSAKRLLRKKKSSAQSVTSDARLVSKVDRSPRLEKKSAKPPKVEVSRDEKVTISAKTTVNDAALADDTLNLYDSKVLGKHASRTGAAAVGEVELVVGLDFGTTYCKAVVQEPGSGRAWAIPFSDTKSARYLLSTKVRASGTSLRLDGPGEMTGNLKVPLLQRKMPPRHAVNVIGFVTLVLRHIKAWVWAHKGEELGNVDVLWSYHLGLPAKNLEDGRLVSTFEKLFWSAALLAEAGGDEVASSDVERSLAYVTKAELLNRDSVMFPGFGEVYRDQIGVYPEVAAQIVGYLYSDRWDRSERRFLLVDIGGGTIDAAIFHVGDGEGELHFGFLGSAVERLGVYILHRRRLEWLVDTLEKAEGGEAIKRALTDALEENRMPATVPGRIEDYLEGAHFPEVTIDKEFYGGFRDMLWDGLLHPVKSALNPGDTQWENLPYLLCGGGRGIALYRNFARSINAPNSSTRVRLREIEMSVPENLSGAGVDTAMYQRLSVAYGLSFRDLGTILAPTNPAPNGPEQHFRDRYVGSELT